VLRDDVLSPFRPLVTVRGMLIVRLEYGSIHC
jgi:hypothetical protein